ncbi:hypothetical protein AB6A40_005658 [Gnathostoma spinigerum]|uniref:Uncharacterized protein n=1 Tax=Gnathostoma spinigerum TaxID=75299 RepID=A0ABD6ENQ9_9BILA
MTMRRQLKTRTRFQNEFVLLECDSFRDLGIIVGLKLQFDITIITVLESVYCKFSYLLRALKSYDTSVHQFAYTTYVRPTKCKSTFRCCKLSKTNHKKMLKPLSLGSLETYGIKLDLWHYLQIYFWIHTSKPEKTPHFFPNSP